MKKFFTLFILSALSSAAFADDFTLYYDASEGTENNKIDAVSNLQKITFEDGKMVVIRKDGSSTSTAITSVKRLFFSTEQAVGIEAPAEQKCANEIYDLTGRKINVQSTDDLTKGIYVVDGKKVLIAK